MTYSTVASTLHKGHAERQQATLWHRHLPSDHSEGSSELMWLHAFDFFHCPTSTGWEGQVPLVTVKDIWLWLKLDIEKLAVV
jgi:hypothetical protein